MAFNKDAVIVAQNATAPAVNLAAAIIEANRERPTTTESALRLFDEVHTHIFNHSMLLGGVESVVEFLNAKPAPQSSGPRGTTRPSSAPSSRNPGDTVVNMGKHKGKTIAEIHDEAPDYLTWLVEKGNNDFLRRQITAFHESA